VRRQGADVGGADAGGVLLGAARGRVGRRLGSPKRELWSCAERASSV